MELYKAADGWGEFKQIKGMGADDVKGIARDGEPFDIYDLQGQKVRSDVTSPDDLPRGIYIINGKKVMK